MRIAVIGAGAIGSIIGGLLARAGEDVMLVGRQPHVDIINKQRLIIDGALGGLTVPVRATEKLNFKPDVAIITVKTQDVTAAVEENAYMLADIPVVTIQNGVQADSMVADVLGKANILSCVVLFGGTFLEPGKVTYSPAGSLVIGESFGGLSNRARGLAAVLNKAIPTRVTANIRGAHWTKLIINENNALPAITGLNFQEVGTDKFLRKLSVLLMREAVTVVQASGITLESLPRVPKILFSVLLPAPMPIAMIFPRLTVRAMGKLPAFGSTLQSIKRGEKTEIDYLNGEIIRLGGKIHHPTPYNTAVVELVHRVEQTGQFLTPQQVEEVITAKTSNS